VLGGVLALYLTAPIAVLLVHLADGSSAGAPTSGLASALATSLLTATVATAIITLFGVPLAWVLSRPHGRIWSVFGVLAQLPLALPPLMSGILLIEVVGPYTAIGRLFGGALTDTPAGIVIAQTFVAAPFLVIAGRSAFLAVPPELLDVAATLGHGPWSRFVRVALPVAADGIRAGMLLAWLRAFGEFGATIILAYHPYSLPVFAWVQFSSTGLASALPPAGLAVAAAALVLLLGSLRLPAMGRLLPRYAATGPAVPPGAPPSGVPAAAAPRLVFELRDRLGDFELDLAYATRTPHLALLGASGAGKSLTLRGLAGLRGTDRGRLRLGDREIGTLDPEARRVGYVPQGQSLLPGLSVWRQVNFGVGTDPQDASRWIHRLGLAELMDRTPDELSGGQRQRVALARALAYAPELLLLDEPLSALDRPVREELRLELRRLQEEAPVATVLVTHDRDEAALLAGDVIVIEAGRALQGGTREEVFAAPVCAQVARLIAPGAHPAVVIEVIEMGERERLALRLDSGADLTTSVPGGDGFVAGQRCLVSLDPVAITVSREPVTRPPGPPAPEFHTR
jgi:ABC-type sulfate/molybdate transport systems ATPase subunit/ABC-type sulfate transport system permease component